MANAEQILAHLAANVRRLRLRRGLTQEALAESAGISTKYLQQIEAGAVNPSVVTLVQVAEALKARVGDLLRQAKPQPRPAGRPKKKHAKSRR